MSEPLWRPGEDRIRHANMTAFMKTVETDWNVAIEDYPSLYRFSIEEKEKFWSSLKGFAGLKAETWGGTVLENAHKMPGAKWFPGTRLNFAENLLKRRDDAQAIVFWGEDKVRKRLSFKDLHESVSRLSQAYLEAGIEPGDRIAGYMPNMPESVIAMLAAAAIGAVWSSCSPDFGEDGVVDRFGQIEPRILVSADGYFYNAKTHDCLETLKGVLRRLPSVEKTVIVPYTNDAPSLDQLPNAVMIGDFMEDFAPAEIDFVHLPFDHPLYIMFSSGTTGVPKCIVHGAGGTLLQHMKEHLLHGDIKPGDRVFYFTTCGWMMWNWLVSALAAQAALLLYDGSPFYPDGNVLAGFSRQVQHLRFSRNASAGVLKPRHLRGVELTAQVISSMSRAV